MLGRGVVALRHRLQALVAADSSLQLHCFAAAAQGAKKQKVTTTKGAKQAASGRDAREESASEKKFKLLLEVCSYHTSGLVTLMQDVVYIYKQCTCVCVCMSGAMPRTPTPCVLIL
jgi:hypothetical protein